MVEDVVSGQTDEGDVPVDAGQTPGSTADTPAAVEPTGSPMGSEVTPAAVVEQPAVDWEKQYHHLEGKLGNWKETEADAERWQQSKTQPEEPVAEEQLPESFNTPQELADFIDQRAEAKAQAILQEKLGPLEQNVYAREARESIDGMRKEFSDFDTHREAIDSYLGAHPAIADGLNDNTLRDVYKIVTYTSAKDKGAQEALARLTKKEADATGAPAAGAPTTPGRPNTFEDAYKAAEQTHGSL